MTKWLSVKMVKPKCSRNPDGAVEPVMIWPHGISDGFAYYGRRATGRPAFYIYGAEVYGVTHWQPLPKGPK